MRFIFDLLAHLSHSWTLAKAQWIHIHFQAHGLAGFQWILRQAGFRAIQTRTIRTPLRLPSTAECVRFERESFGALQQILVGLAEAEHEAAWDEIERVV